MSSVGLEVRAIVCVMLYCRLQITTEMGGQAFFVSLELLTLLHTLVFLVLVFMDVDNF